ncbi:MAG: hypothetical protein WC197_00330 [Candidatus Gastranaerophilaceae bacterium]
MKKRKGAALILAVTLSSLLLLTAFALTVNAISDVKLTNNDKIKTEIELACFSGIKRAKAKIENSFNNNALIVLEPNVTFQGSSKDDTDLTPGAKAFNDETFTLGHNLDYYSFTYHSNISNKDITVMYGIFEQKNWTKSQNYTTYEMNVESIAYIPDYGWVGMQQTVDAKRTTLFMYQVFFQNDLEILPGPDFTLKGLIHTNQDLYLNANSTLKIYTDSMTSAGNAHRGRFDSTDVTGTVQISKGNANGSLTTMTAGQDSTNKNWQNIATNNWAGTLRDKSLGATTLAAPNLGSFGKNGYYANEADLNISVNAKGKTLSTTTYNITLNGATQTYTSTQLGGALKEVQIYDKREFSSKQIQVTKVDIASLSNILGTPENGLVYMTRDDAVADSDNNLYTPDSKRVVSGFEMTNGSVLNSATTFVTDLPVYVKGDFNLHTNSDPSTDTWQPCAVIADAITLLSNSWVDSKSSTTQTASNSTYNFVFITGNVPTKPGQYSGGLENFPRFLENWSGKSANISGGFMQLFRSQYATGLWNGSYYSPPTRNWGAESRFSNLQDLPPDYANLFPSTNLGITYSEWEKIDKESSLLEDEI